jgi:NADPH:quinone reductase-like Zn-dependent oxidoreductase
MKAAIRKNYGPPKVLSIQEVDKPTPKEDEILVKVHAATVNRTDCANLTAKPLVMHLVVGFLKPKLPTTGTDFAGEVEAVGQAVSEFKVGDRVFGFFDTGLSSHAQYLVIAENKPVVKMPEKLGYEEVAASAEGMHYAINAINKVKLSAGQKAVVNGASGAIGSAGLQLLKDMGLTVTAVCAGKDFAKIKALGADRVIDYTKEDFTKDSERYDFVFDSVGKSTFGKCKPLLKPNGTYISSELGPWGQNIFFALATPMLGGKKVAFPVPYNPKESLIVAKKMLEKGTFKPLIDKVFPLEKIREAFEYVASGQKVGNVIVRPFG